MQKKRIMYKNLHLRKKSIIFAENMEIRLKVGPNKTKCRTKYNQLLNN